jgi:hypothetical protein
MNSNADDEETHISEGRLVEVSKGSLDLLSEYEKNHIARCDRCNRLLGALFRLERGDY